MEEETGKLQFFSIFGQEMKSKEQKTSKELEIVTFSAPVTFVIRYTQSNLSQWPLKIT